MTLLELQRQVSEWADYNFEDAEPYHPLLGLTEEVGELAHAHLKTEQGIRGDCSMHFEDKVDAVGDIVIYLAHYCYLNGINLEEAVGDTWAKVKQRDWKVNPNDGNT